MKWHTWYNEVAHQCAEAHRLRITAVERWRKNQEFSSVDFIPPRFSMLLYNLGDEQ
jgi:hypothetical protein